MFTIAPWRATHRIARSFITTMRTARWCTAHMFTIAIE